MRIVLRLLSTTTGKERRENEKEKQRSQPATPVPVTSAQKKDNLILMRSTEASDSGWRSNLGQAGRQSRTQETLKTQETVETTYYLPVTNLHPRPVTLSRRDPPHEPGQRKDDGVDDDSDDTYCDHLSTIQNYAI